ncbi:TRAP transporter substrate-binding protein [Amycolatopsis palatopharyngis]|uniref:TRAP transporter substrate-binding protein n=1 Tax=Amycolatopsis palatopharyngis TaxID=187982 RepID=UPI000E24492C|nr:TRAP transporter substrate-binding protein [Amycolatopsis palatopharyngis]
MNISRRNFLWATAGTGLFGIAGCGGSGSGGANGGSGGRKFKLAYEGPKGTAHEIAANVFQEGLDKASNSELSIQQFPAGQLGGEPELLEKVRSGDIDFILSSTANAAAIAPPSGILSAHYLFGNQDDVISVVSNEAVNEAYMEMAKSQVSGARPLTMFTLPLRNFYADFAVRTINDIKGKKIRVQATKTEDKIFAAYGAQTVHMGFPELYSSLQTGVVEMAENALTYYGLNKHYEVAPTMSFSEHAGNCQILWVSDKLWKSMSPDERSAVTQAAMKVRKEQPTKAFELQGELKSKYGEMGVQFIENVDKSGFQEISLPLQDEIAESLGDNAVTILEKVRKVTDG